MSISAKSSAKRLFVSPFIDPLCKRERLVEERRIESGEKDLGRDNVGKERVHAAIVLFDQITREALWILASDPVNNSARFDIICNKV